MPPTKKRAFDDTVVPPKSKKIKLDDKTKKHKTQNVEVEKSAPTTAHPTTEELDFPRGGGTSFTPLEVKTIRAEAHKEADDQLFDEGQTTRLKKRKSKTMIQSSSLKTTAENKQSIRIEHLSYKRVTVGMKVFCQIVSIGPLVIIVSLPNQLFAHVPITHISSRLTKLLETVDEVDDEDGYSDEDTDGAQIPRQQSKLLELFEVFRPGQYVRAVVTAVHAAGSTDISGMERPRDGMEMASRRVELSLEPEKVNGSVVKADLTAGFVLSAAVDSIEDHGYILDLGMSEVSGFLSFKNAKKALGDNYKNIQLGQLLDVLVQKLSANGRTCDVSIDEKSLKVAFLTEVTNPSSLLPGTLVQSLITAVLPDGLNLQVLGFFEGTIDPFHLPPRKLDNQYKIGKKIKARIIYDITASSPPKFSLSLAEHVLSMDVKRAADLPLQETYPIGTILDAVKVTGVETERGLTVEGEHGVSGFVHISQISDQHVPSLPSASGHWKVGTVHRARVTGYFPFDGYLQLSFRQSILDRKFLQVADVQVGEVVRGTIKKLTDSALFVSLSGNVDGVVWPTHYADIALKHPEKRFKPGGTIKCRVLVVEPARRRIVLSAKKTLTESTHPLITKLEDAKIGLVTHAVVSRIFDKSLQVEFYSHVKATVTMKEASESLVGPLSSNFDIGKPVQVRIISVDNDRSRILASIRQAASNFESPTKDISAVEIGNAVDGTIIEIHKENAVLLLHPTEIRALISLPNLANRRGTPVGQLRASLNIGEKLADLVVVSRNPAQGFVIVAHKPKAKSALPFKGSSISMETIQIGQIVGGRVLRHDRKGAFVKLTTHISGSLYPTDTCDNYENGTPFPPVDSLVKAAVTGIDREKNQLSLSTRHSRMYPSRNHTVVDREIQSLDDLKVGETVRGFIKSVTDHGLFVMLGRDMDARVQIKELFDDFIKDWKPRFQANQLVKGRILIIDKEKRKVEMSFRSGEFSRDPNASMTLSDLEEGQKVDGLVKKIEDYGIFLRIEGTKLSGLCHKSELSDNKDSDVTLALRSFREGDRVRALVLSVDLEKKRVSFSLKPSHFKSDDDAEDSEEELDSDRELEPEGLGVIEDVEMLEVDAQRSEGPAEEEEEDLDADEVVPVDPEVGTISFGQPSITTDGSIPMLNVKHGIQWSHDTPHTDDSDVSSDITSDSDAENQGGKKKKRKRKEIEQDLTADLSTKMPDSNADFERLLLGSPNSSYLWIQYMSFQLQLSEVDKAREIAHRALTVINFREEREKLNVWISLLNLENVYGTDDSIEATFRDAARHNDAKTIYLRLAAIFEQSDKYEKAVQQYSRTVKKFGQSSKVWTLFGEFYLKRGDLEQARKLLPRSLQSLEKRKHLKTICKFAQLEYKLGDPERGKTIFEGIVESHPKRWDLWSIYIDMEAGQQDIQGVRALFDHLFAIKMTSHKAKSFFKKWLELEKAQGDEEGTDAVKQKAIQWTQRAAKS